MQGTPGHPSYPKTIAGLSVTSVRDLTIGYDSANPPTYKPVLPLSSGQMVQFRAESPTDGTKITLTTRYVPISGPLTLVRTDSDMTAPARVVRSPRSVVVA